MGAQTPAAVSEEFAIPDFENPACVGTDPEIFFPRSTSETREMSAKNTLPFQFYPGSAIKPNDVAKAICKGCRHLEECRGFALNNNIRYGIWGGTTEMERRRLKKLMYDG